MKIGETPFAKIPASEYIGVATAASKQYLNISRRQVTRLCESGRFKSAFKGGTQASNSKWQMLRSEVIQHKMRGYVHAEPKY